MTSIDAIAPKTSKYLAQADVGEEGRDLVVLSIDPQLVGQNDDQETKLVLTFTDKNYKPMILNAENRGLLKLALGTDQVEKMVGRAINIWANPMIAFGGKITGGLRIRKAKNSAPGKPTARPVQPSKPYSEPEDDGPPSPPLEAYDDESSVPF